MMYDDAGKAVHLSDADADILYADWFLMLTTNEMRRKEGDADRARCSCVAEIILLVSLFLIARRSTLGKTSLALCTVLLLLVVGVE